MPTPTPDIGGPNKIPQPLQPIKTDAPQNSLEDFDITIIIEQQEENLPPIQSQFKILQEKRRKATTEGIPKTLESAAKEIEENLEIFAALLKEENTANQIVDNVISVYEVQEELNSLGATIIKEVQKFRELIGEEIDASEKKRVEAHAEVTKIVSDATDVLRIIQNSSLLTQKKMLLKQRKAEFKEKSDALKNEPPDHIKEKETELRALKESIQQLSYEVTEDTKTTVLKVGLMMPDFAEHIYSAVKFFAGLQNQLQISGAIGIAGAATGIAGAGYDLYTKSKEASSHKKHIQDLESLRLKEFIKNDQPSFPTKRDTELTEDEITLKGQTAARVEQENKTNLSKIFSNRINELKEKHANNFPAFKNALAARGIMLENDPLKDITSLNKYDINSYEDFDKKLEDPEFKARLEQQFNSVRSLDTIDRQDLTANQRTVKALLDKRQQVKNERVKEETAWFNKLINDYGDDFNGFRQRLEKEGITFDKGINSFDNLTLKIQQELIEKHIEYKDTLTITAKNQLKARLKEHEKINHKFFRFKLNTSKVLFGFTTVSCIGSIVLSAGLIAGLAFPPSLFVIPTVIGIATAVGSIAIGLYYLHKNKPNLTETYLKLVPLQIIMNQVPIAFANLCLLIEELKKDWLYKEIQELADEAFNKPNEDLEFPKGKIDEEIIVDQKERLAEIEGGIKEWTKIKDNYQKKIDELNEQVLQARKDDFELKTGFNSFSKENLQKIEMKQKIAKMKVRRDELYAKTLSSLTKKERNELLSLSNKIKYLEDKISKLQDKTADEFTIIAEALIKGEFWKDPEAAKLIHKYGGVELEKELKLESSMLEKNKTFLSQRLRDIILRNSKEILEWLEKQNIREVEV